VITLAIVIGTITIAIGSFFGAVTKIVEFIDRFEDPKPKTVAELQNTVRITALELKQSFESVTSGSGKTPPIPDDDFAHVRRLIARIERLDPGNGHAIYYNGFIVRWRNQRPQSHSTLFWYLERAKDANLHLPGDNGDTRFCFENWLGYCKERQAFIHHVLALDFEQAAREEPDPATSLGRLKSALDHAQDAIELYGEFNAPGQGMPTRALAESLRKQIAKAEQRLNTSTVGSSTTQ
jgi:hypothetical protein